MLRKTCCIIVVLCLMLFFGCAGNKTQAVLQIPLLQYDSEQGTLYAAQWNLGEQTIVSEKTVLLQQQDIDAVMRIKWDGDGYIILPQASYNKPFSKVNADFFHQIIEMKHTCEVLHGSWRCWKEDKDTVYPFDNSDYGFPWNGIGCMPDYHIHCKSMRFMRRRSLRRHWRSITDCVCSHLQKRNKSRLYIRSIT